MVFRHVSFLLLILIIASGIAPAAAGELGLKVVYPNPEQRLPAVDSTFIFGSVTPGASLDINGAEIPVHEEGGWLAFLPVKPDTFDFVIRAEKDGVVDTMIIRVYLPVLHEPDFDSLYFRAGKMRPWAVTWVMPGDYIPVSFQGTPYCNAVCIVENSGDTIRMTETAAPYLRGKSVFDLTDDTGEAADEEPVRGGVYEATIQVPDNVGERLRLIFELYPPSAQQLTWLINYHMARDKSTRLFHKFGSMPAYKLDTLDTDIRILSPERPMVAELRDSLTVIRTGPGKGYLCIHQPAGIRAEVAGKSGKWLRLRLSEYQYGWVPDTNITYLPEGTQPPRSRIRRIQTVSTGDGVSIRVGTQARHPFRVVENIDEKSMTVYLYGVDGDTDWIRYDNRDEMIDHIVWTQPEPGLYALTIYLTQDRMWGYDGHYVGDEFSFDIRKRPGDHLEISDLRIILDPGHSPDPGAVGPTGLTEGEANLAIALQLAKDLRREGAEVVLTRSDDSPLPLYDRPKIALREEGDIFISVHNNALPDGTNPFVNNGVSTFYYHPHSVDLARAVHDAMAGQLGLRDFGWYYGNLAVNRPTQYPAILIESAFMMIPEQEAMLKSSKFQKKISKAVVTGIKDWLRGRPLTEWDRRLKESYNR
jgi:N-acetylmuramoyl-L-alanine amidase